MSTTARYHTIDGKAPKVGIIGAGSIASYHVEGFRQGGADIVAVADKNPGAAKKFAEKYGIPMQCSSIEEMVELCPSLDAVSIATPNFLHLPLALNAFSHSLSVYCEKPPALNAGEVRQILEASKESGRLLVFDFNNRARAESSVIRKYIDNGEVGRINSAQAVWVRRSGIPAFGTWFTNKKLAGGGPVIDLLHTLDLALYFMNYPEPEYITACTYNDFISDPAFKGPWGIPNNDNGVTNVESACHGFITFETGQCLFVRSAWAEMNDRERISVVFQGTKAGGKIERLFEVDGIDETSTDTCTLYTVENGHHVNREVFVPRDETMGRVASAKNFIDALTGKAAPLNVPEEALKLMKIIDAIYTSAAEHKPVKFDKV